MKQSSSDYNTTTYSTNTATITTTTNHNNDKQPALYTCQFSPYIIESGPLRWQYDSRNNGDVGESICIDWRGFKPNSRLRQCPCWSGDSWLGRRGWLCVLAELSPPLWNELGEHENWADLRQCIMHEELQGSHWILFRWHQTVQPSGNAGRSLRARRPW